DVDLTNRLDDLSTDARSLSDDTSGYNPGSVTVKTVSKPGQPSIREFYNEKGVKLEVRQLSIDYDPKKWLEHVVELSDRSGKWCCTWNTMRNGEPATCGYTAKKHLVKRHIEATHMNIKSVLFFIVF